MAMENSRWRAKELGEGKELRLRQGTIRYHETGSGPPVVFVHGVLANANLWRKVIAKLAPDFRCVALDLPLGAHLVPMPPEADLSPPAIADLIGDALEALGLEDVTLVANDTGGAFSQILVTRRPERIGRLFLTSCDAFDYFPPKALRPVLPIVLLPGAIPVLFAPLRMAAIRHRVATAIRITKRPIERQAADSYGFPVLESPAIRRDTQKVLKGAEKRYTLEAAERLRDFDRPVLIAWSREDRFFPPRLAEGLAERLPDVRLEWIHDAYTFSPEDQPERVAALIAGFVREPAPARAG